MEGTLLDQYVARLQNMEPFEVYAVNPIDGSVSPWYTVTGEIVKDVVIREDALAVQVSAVSAQILHWGRHAAQCKRVWEVEERKYRTWRARRILELSAPPKDPEAAKSWKRPTAEVMQATYESDPQYDVLYRNIERAEEAFNAATAIQDAFKAKRDMMKAAVARAQDSGQPRLTV